MTRINTNLSSLVAQKTLQRSNTQLNESLTRLSTGLRINAGKDDPAGLIASEMLRSDIISVRKAITNSERANQLIATADSALGQVSSLLNDIRGLVSEAANTGALSDSQVQANQLQIDSSLEAIDRISQVTSFQGSRLLDGNLDFTTSGVSSDIQDLQIDQANFGSLSQIGVGVDVVEQATQGQLTYEANSITEDVVLEIAGSNGTEAFNFASGSSISQIASAVNLISDATGVRASVEEQPATAGEITVSSVGANNDIVLTAKEAGQEAGNYNVRYDASAGAAELSVSYTAPAGETAGTIDVTLATTQWEAASRAFEVEGNNNDLELSAKVKGEDFNGVKLNFIEDAGLDGGAPTVAYDHDNKTLSITIDDTDTTAASIKTALEGTADVAALFSLENVGDSDGSGTISFADAEEAADDFNTTVGDVSGGLNGGVDGGEITSTAAEVVAAINSTAGLKDLVGAALASGNDGSTAVTDFAAFASYGDAADNNQLQFLGPDGSRDIEFRSTAGTALSVDLDPTAANEAKAQAVVQSPDANSSFIITAKQAGDAFNDIDIVINDSTDGTVVFDEESKSLTLNIDLTGGINASEIQDLIEGDAYASEYFDVSLLGDGGTDLDAAFVGTVGTTSGGGAADGKVIVNLATNAAGEVTTTAQDLVDYFNSSDSSIVSALEDLGISVSNAEGSDGTGLLAATEAGEAIEFATSGRTFTDANAAGTTYAVGGAGSQLTFTATEVGAAYDDVSIVFAETAGAAGDETFAYNEETKTLTVGIHAASTAADVAASLDDAGNEDVAELFTVVATDGTGAGVVTATFAEATATTTAAQGANAQLTFTATETGAEFDDISIVFEDTATAGAETFAYDEDTRTVTVGIESGVSTATQVAAAIDAAGNEDVAEMFTVAAGGTGAGTVTETIGNATVTTTAANGANAELTITAINEGGDYDDIEIIFTDTATAGDETFVYDENAKTLTIGIEDGVSTATQVAAAIGDAGNEVANDLFTIAAGGTGADAVTDADTGTTAGGLNDRATTSGGYNDRGALSGGVVMGGTTDGAAFLGNADAAASGLSFTAVDYGTDAFVSVKALSGAFALIDRSGDAAERSVGTDINARINGIQAIGDGLRTSLNTSSLDLSFNVAETAASGTSYSFNITGGGAQFQLGPDVVSNQQARLGIQSVSTATLGGVSGRLFELRSGGNKALNNDVGGAARVVDEVIERVTSLRGRLGAFQKTTLETNIFTLNDTLVNLTEAESSIRDADFAAESANLTRAQILVQSGTSVLSIANSNPQNVLSLLR